MSLQVLKDNYIEINLYLVVTIRNITVHATHITPQTILYSGIDLFLDHSWL